MATPTRTQCKALYAAMPPPAASSRSAANFAASHARGRNRHRRRAARRCAATSGACGSRCVGSANGPYSAACNAAASLKLNDVRGSTASIPAYLPRHHSCGLTASTSRTISRWTIRSKLIRKFARVNALARGEREVLPKRRGVDRDVDRR